MLTQALPGELPNPTKAHISLLALLAQRTRSPRTAQCNRRSTSVLPMGRWTALLESRPVEFQTPPCESAEAGLLDSPLSFEQLFCSTRCGLRFLGLGLDGRSVLGPLDGLCPSGHVTSVTFGFDFGVGPTRPLVRVSALSSASSHM